MLVEKEEEEEEEGYKYEDEEEEREEEHVPSHKKVTRITITLCYFNFINDQIGGVDGNSTLC